MKTLSIAAIFLITATFVTVEATPTRRGTTYDNAISTNGRYKVEVKAPYGKGFYKLIDLEKRGMKTLWRRKQGRSERSCDSLFVDNDGWVTICTAGSDLIFVNPEGRDTGTVNLLQDALQKEDWPITNQYQYLRSYPPHWEAYGLWYFLSIGDLRLFVIRTFWDRRIIVNIKTGILLTENDALSKACLAHEKDFVLNHLKKEFEVLESGPEYDDPIYEDVYLAGKLRLTEAIPLLRALEDWPQYDGEASTGRVMFEEGEVDPFNYSHFYLRRIVANSLRCLGEIPRQSPNYQFRGLSKDNKKHYYKAPPLIHKRHTLVDELRVGMKVREILALIGSPDLIDNDLHSPRGNWEYDMDDETPYSLILLWENLEVISIERILPPLWDGSKIRDELMISVF